MTESNTEILKTPLSFYSAVLRCSTNMACIRIYLETWKVFISWAENCWKSVYGFIQTNSSRVQENPLYFFLKILNSLKKFIKRPSISFGYFSAVLRRFDIFSGKEIYIVPIILRVLRTELRSFALGCSWSVLLLYESWKRYGVNSSSIYRCNGLFMCLKTIGSRNLSSWTVRELYLPYLHIHIFVSWP